MRLGMCRVCGIPIEDMEARFPQPAHNIDLKASVPKALQSESNMLGVLLSIL